MSSNKLSIPPDRKNHIFETSYVIKSFALQINPLTKTKPRLQQLTLDKQDLELPGILQAVKIKQLEPINRRQQSQIKLNSQKNFQKGVKKILYRASDGKKRKLLSRGKITMKIKPFENKGLAVFYRNQTVSLINLLNRKVDYFNCLKNKRTQLQIPLRSNDIEELLQKELILKGKDKGRQKFNNITNQQLKSIGYKPKASSNFIKKQPKTKQQKQEQQVSQNGDDANEQNIDIATWKRRNGCGAYQKVFIVKGGYMDLRQGLLEKGWFENQDVYSCHFDMKWTTKISDIDYGKLKNGQSVNHFNNNHHLTSKYGITRRLKTLIMQHSIDIDKFYPRCFDLGDQTDLQNFIESFKYSFAQSVAKRFLLDKKRYIGLELKIRTILQILKRRIKNFSTLLSQINNGIFPVITPQEWAIITQQIQPDEIEDKLQKINRFQENLDPSDPQYQIKLFQILDLQIRKNIQILNDFDPQMHINGMNNVWIVKPNFLSRGRGIKCFNNIYDICDYCLGRDLQFVVQKYIERPLLVNGKKFDIRQWVFIQDFNPPKIWFYEECYLRFCADEYNLQNIHNKFGHLTNNSIQKLNKKAIIKESMWSKNQFEKYIGQQNWLKVQEKIKNIVVWSIKSCEGYVTGKKGSFELVGYDFMIDEDLNPWLIEINMSPSMDYSTPVTTKLVRSVLTDTAHLIASKKQQSIGKFTCIYKGPQDLKKYNLYEI